MRLAIFLFFAATPLFAQERVTISRPDGTRIVVGGEPAPLQRRPAQAPPVRETVFRPVQVTEYVPMPVTATRYYGAPAAAAPVCAAPPVVAVERRPATPIRSAIRGFFGRN